MKDGRVANQGTFQDIIEDAPELYSEYQQAVKTATETETETEEILSRMSEEERREVFRKKINQDISVESSKRQIDPTAVILLAFCITLFTVIPEMETTRLF